MAPLDGEKNRCRKEEGREVERRKEGRERENKTKERERMEDVTLQPQSLEGLQSYT